MNILSVLKDDHRNVSRLIEQLKGDGAGGEATRRLFEQLCEAIEAHAEAEEDIVYPVLSEKIGDEDEIMEESEAEHSRVEEILADMEDLTPGTEAFMECLGDLEELIMAHVETEETEVFHMLRKLCDETQLVQMGRAVAERIGRKVQVPINTPTQQPHAT